jgi:hypothetical protein
MHKERDHYFTLYTNISSQWMKHLDISLETLQLLEENLGKNLGGKSHSFRLAGDFNKTPKVQKTK